MSESWVEKHRPTTFSEIQGNNKDVRELKAWVENFTPGDDAQLLVGPPGVGKTTTAQVLSKHFGYPLNQINASDARGGEGIREMAGEMASRPANAEHQIVLVDEVDSQHHATNKRPLYDALEMPKNPVLLTANDEYSVPKPLKRKVNIREFSLRQDSRRAKLRKIAEKEGVEIGDRELEQLSERPGLRSAIHDLQLWAEQDIPPGEDQREWELGEFDVVDKILRGEMESGSMAPPDLLLWLDENLSREYRGVEAMTAYDTLSRADKWLDRAQKEDYRYWKYAGELIEQTATQRVTEPFEGYIKKDFPEWFRHSTPGPKDDSPEAKLFRALKGLTVTRDGGRKRLRNDDGGFVMGGGFHYFCETLLPILQDLPTEERLQLARRYRVDKTGLKALNLTEKQYESWANQEVPEDREKDEDELLQQSALSW